MSIEDLRRELRLTEERCVVRGLSSGLARGF